MTPADTEIARLLDETAIARTIARGVRGADRCDADLLKSAYWPDATYRHIFASGNAWECMEQTAAMLAEKTEAAVHNLGSMCIEIDGDDAACETYATNFIRVRSPDHGAISVIITARLLDRFERRDSEWRIADRKVVPEWQLNAAAMIGEEGVERFFSDPRQGREDPSYALFAAITSGDSVG